MSSIVTPLPVAAPAARGAFDSVTIFMHWATVGLVTLMFASAYAMHGGVMFSAGEWLFVHRSTGVSLWVLTAFRLFWRVALARFPEFPQGMSALRRWTVVGSERLLYCLMLVQPLTGLLMTLLRGKPFALLWWQIPPLLPKNLEMSLRLHDVHEVCAYALLSVIIAHAARALLHHYLLDDDLLRAMLPRETSKT